MGLIDGDYEVDVVGRSRLTLEAGHDGTRDHVVDFDTLQRVDDPLQ